MKDTRFLKDVSRGLGKRWGLIGDPALPTPVRRKARIRRLLLLVILIAYFPYTIYVHGTSCLIAATTGLPCPTCGSTRAAVCLAHGNRAGANYWHPLIPLSLVILLFAIGYYLYRAGIVERARREGKEPPRGIFSTSTGKTVIFGLLVLYLTVYLVRMIRYYPDREPFTYNERSQLGRLIGAIRRIFE